MAFLSILFDGPVISSEIDGREAPEFFTDLNLDQVVASITAGREQYNLNPFFYTPLRDVAMINYRHDVLRDLENQALLRERRAVSQQTGHATDHPARHALRVRDVSR